MSSYPPPGPGGAGRLFEETIERLEAELRRAVGYMNDTVVPQVRRESISAMRKMAGTLQNMADRFDKGQSQAPPSKPEDRKP